MESVILPPEMVVRQWSTIYPMIRDAMPDASSWGLQTESCCQQQVLSGQLVVWAMRVGGKINGIFTTTIIVDAVSGSKMLLVYSIYATSSKESRGGQLIATESMRETVKDYARKRGASKLVAYIRNPKALMLAKHMGFDCETHFAQLEV